ncbi:hypothetical protein Pmani_036564 [Petrolisthes manimaculis]|uniref:Uncharacterized protein n=1 Tax=Petrolisthes manimaculis TaxID=1843537 RepID=A0AAE1NJ42_9EUCA|nr:hypothetical protein Pmani_036564 [Petrolisthes manimaculis]
MPSQTTLSPPSYPTPPTKPIKTHSPHQKPLQHQHKEPESIKNYLISAIVQHLPLHPLHLSPLSLPLTTSVTSFPTSQHLPYLLPLPLPLPTSHHPLPYLSPPTSLTYHHHIPYLSPPHPLPLSNHLSYLSPSSSSSSTTTTITSDRLPIFLPFLFPCLPLHSPVRQHHVLAR